MAAESRAAPQHLSFLRSAARDIRRFGVFALLRGAEARAPQLPRIGASRLPAADIVALRQEPHLEFPGPTLHGVEFRGERAEVAGYWLGLTGPMGALPLHLTEYAAWERLYSAKRPFGGFLDLLASRMLQLFYRAWADSQPAAQADRPADDRFADYLAALSGAAAGVGEAAAFPARARLFYAGVFASRRSPAAIQNALQDLLRVNLRLVEFQPRWRAVAPSDRSRLGGPFARLGRDAMIGRHVFSADDAFRIIVSVDDMRDYEDFLPTGRRFAIAAEALEALSPSHLEWDVALEIDRARVRALRLDGRGRLGWTAWLAPRGEDGVHSDAHLNKEAQRLGRREKVGTFS